MIDSFYEMLHPCIILGSIRQAPGSRRGTVPGVLDHAAGNTVIALRAAGKQVMVGQSTRIPEILNAYDLSELITLNKD